MKTRTLIGLLTLITLLGSSAWSAELLKAENPIPGRYIVVFRQDALGEGPSDAYGGGTLDLKGRSMALLAGGRLQRILGHALPAVVIETDATGVQRLLSDPSVAYVAEDAVVRAAGVETAPPSWGLDRIDQRDPSLDGAYTYHATGQGAHLYVVDSGVRSTHQDLAGRVDTSEAFSAIDDGYGTEDAHGHGTFVAAVAAGSTYGVAKAATIHPVRVLNAYGWGSVSDVVAGLDWVVANHQDPAVVVMSLVTQGNTALDDAVRACLDAGITVVAAAGNEGGDACLDSPARVEGAITVGATDQSDTRAPFSNAGPCVDLFAPGTGIVSAWAGSDDDAVTMDGTSAAAPHAAGIAALYLSLYPWASPDEVAWALTSQATPGVADPAGAPDLLAYSAFVDDSVDRPPFAIFDVLSCRNRRCRLDASGSTDDDRIVSYSWDFGDGTFVDGKKSSKIGHRFPSTGAAFPVTLTVTDSVGQSTSYQREIRFSW